MNPVLLSVAGNPENQDCGLVVTAGSRTVLCVADGAGGLSGGTEAAVMAAEFVRQHAPRLASAGDCANLLQRADAAIAKDIAAGETTLITVVIDSTEIFGASVGDSGAWFIPPTGQWIDLSGRQQRKPFVGSGSARSVPFQRGGDAGLLLLATDGLLKYTSAERIVEICRHNAPDVAAQKLIELVKYPSGRFPDDVTVILMNTH